MASINTPKRSPAARSAAGKNQTTTKARNGQKRQNANGRARPMQSARKSHAAAQAKTPNKKTKITVKCNCGFPNNLYIRGEGIKGLSWEKGTLMKCTKDDEWVWETTTSFRQAKIKVLLNDCEFEQGENHNVACGKSISFAPRF